MVQNLKYLAWKGMTPYERNIIRNTMPSAAYNGNNTAAKTIQRPVLRRMSRQSPYIARRTNTYNNNNGRKPVTVGPIGRLRNNNTPLNQFTTGTLRKKMKKLLHNEITNVNNTNEKINLMKTMLNTSKNTLINNIGFEGYFNWYISKLNKSQLVKILQKSYNNARNFYGNY